MITMWVLRMKSVATEANRLELHKAKLSVWMMRNCNHRCLLRWPVVLDSEILHMSWLSIWPKVEVRDQLHIRQTSRQVSDDSCIQTLHLLLLPQHVGSSVRCCLRRKEPKPGSSISKRVRKGQDSHYTGVRSVDWKESDYCALFARLFLNWLGSMEPRVEVLTMDTITQIWKAFVATFPDSCSLL